MTDRTLFLDFNLVNFEITISVGIAIGVVLGGTTLAGYIIANPTKIEKWVALFYRLIKWAVKSAEYSYIKYDIQSQINDFTAKLKKDVPNIIPTKVKLEWINTNETKEEFIKNDTLVIRMQQSSNENRNVMRAVLTYVSYSLLTKAKKYIAPYQKDAIDYFVSFNLFEKENPGVLNEFVQEVLQKGLEKANVEDFYLKFLNLHKAGLFYQIFITEMTFLGEKVFGSKRDSEKIFEEVKSLVYHLNNYSQRKLHDESMRREFIGEYCKFSIRIVGTSTVLEKKGERKYINEVEEVSKIAETIYIIGNTRHRKYIDRVADSCVKRVDYSIFKRRNQKVIIKDTRGNDKKVNNILVVLRKDNPDLHHVAP